MTRSSALRARALAAAGALLAWGLGILATAGWFVVRSSARAPEGTLPLPGLASRVLVVSDSFGIPSVFAEHEADALRAEGYLHASDRLWQMELFRRIASGRLAEVFGERALPTDRFVRTLDLWGAAGRALEVLSEAERARLRAYAEGVNARLREKGRVRPPELLLLGIRPEPWDPRASLAMGIVMNLDLSHWRNDLARFRARSFLTLEQSADLVLPYPDWGPTILSGPAPTPSVPAGRAAAGSAPGGRRAAGPVAARPPGRARDRAWSPLDVLAAAGVRNASNAWAVDATRTRDGSAILANDMHLRLRAPSLWYVAALHARASGLDVAGFTLPGVPGVVVGYNRGIAWGFTNGMVDDMDFAVEEASADGASYREDGAWVPFRIRTETIRVRGRAAPDTLRVRETLRGPLISDALEGLGADLSAVWIAAHPDVPTTGLGGMAAARTLEALDGAVAGFASPHQNVVFASVSGRIGYRLGGRIPLRGGSSGALPVPARDMGRGWPGMWPPALHPGILDPAAGFVATANNLQARNLYGRIGEDYPVPFRARRISDVLASRDDWTVETTAGLQRDVRSLLAERVLPACVAAARRIGADSTARRLESWDRDVSLTSRAAPILYAWLFRLRELLAADEFQEAPDWAFFPTSALLRAIEREDQGAWVDDVRTPDRERFADLAERALVDALRVTEGRTWGELHVERNGHALGRVRWLERLLDLDVGPYPSTGGPNTVRPDDYGRWNALDSTSWRPPWISEYGPSERFIARLSEAGARGWFILPTGQNGNPFSAHYRDMSPRWREGRFIPLSLDSVAVERRAARRFTLTPGAGPGGPTEDGGAEPGAR
ncbi:MAG: penicillin acylase family protein [Gemmatimonadota bacterium]